MQFIPGSNSQVQLRCDFVMKTFFEGAVPETVEDIGRLAEALRSLTENDHPHTISDRFRESITTIKGLIDNPGLLIPNPDDQKAFRSIALAKIVAKITELSLLKPADKLAYMIRIQAEAQLQSQLIRLSRHSVYNEEVYHPRGSGNSLVDKCLFLDRLREVYVPERESTHPQMPVTIKLMSSELMSSEEEVYEVHGEFVTQVQ